MMQDNYYTTGGAGACRPMPPQNPQVQGVSQSSDDCGCRASLVQALQMLLRSGLSAYVDFQNFAFLTDLFVVGASIVQPTVADPAYDDLSELTGSFGGFTPCACEYIDVTGPVYSIVAAVTDTGLTVNRLRLCDVSAIAFEVEGDTVSNYQSARQLISQIIQSGRRESACPPYPDPCCEPCDVMGDALSVGRTVSLTAGPLILSGAVVLGRIGKVLVLANDTQSRFYFLCEDAIQLLR